MDENTRLIRDRIADALAGPVGQRKAAELAPQLEVALRDAGMLRDESEDVPAGAGDAELEAIEKLGAVIRSARATVAELEEPARVRVLRFVRDRTGANLAVLLEDEAEPEPEPAAEPDPEPEAALEPPADAEPALEPEPIVEPDPTSGTS